MTPLASSLRVRGCEKCAVRVRWANAAASTIARLGRLACCKLDRASRILFDHLGETALPTSCFLCETGGMIVICAGPTGLNATLDPLCTRVQVCVEPAVVR